MALVLLRVCLLIQPIHGLQGNQRCEIWGAWVNGSLPSTCPILRGAWGPRHRPWTQLFISAEIARPSSSSPRNRISLLLSINPVSSESTFTWAEGLAGQLPLLGLLPAFPASCHSPANRLEGRRGLKRKLEKGTSRSSLKQQ